MKLKHVAIRATVTYENGHKAHSTLSFKVPEIDPGDQIPDLLGVDRATVERGMQAAAIGQQFLIMLSENMAAHAGAAKDHEENTHEVKAPAKLHPDQRN